MDPCPRLLVDVCERVSRCAADNIDTLRNTRTTSSWWSKPAARLVERVGARGCQLPAKAWSVFPNARGLVFVKDDIPRDEYFSGLTQLADSLPEQLEEALVPNDGASSQWKGRHDADPGIFSFLERLAFRSCTSQLKSVIIHSKITPSAADAVFTGLPCLQRAHVTIVHEASPAQDDYHISSFPATLQDLKLETRCESAPGSQHISAAALTACSDLQRVHLSLDHTQLLNPTSISRCTALQSLHLTTNTSNPESLFLTSCRSIMAVADQLLQLRELNMPLTYIRCSSHEWQQLASLTNLQALASAGSS